MKLVFLSKEFFLSYPKDLYNELLQNEFRPYVLIKVRGNRKIFFAIPARTELEKKEINEIVKERNENNIFLLKRRGGGLDYEKTVLIYDHPEFISKKTVYDDNLKLDLEECSDYIIDSFQKYIKKYVSLIHSRNIPSFSTLIYFLVEFNISLLDTRLIEEYIEDEIEEDSNELIIKEIKEEQKKEQSNKQQQIKKSNNIKNNFKKIKNTNHQTNSQKRRSEKKKKALERKEITIRTQEKRRIENKQKKEKRIKEIQLDRQKEEFIKTKLKEFKKVCEENNVIILSFLLNNKDRN